MLPHSQTAPPRNPTLRLLALFKDRKKTVALLVLFVILASTFDIIVPFISKNLIDTLIAFFKEGGASPVPTLVLSAIGILLFTIFTRVLKSSYDFRLFKTVTQVEDSVRHRTFEKYLQLHAIFHHSSSSGQIIGRIDRGGSAIYAILNDIFGQNLLPPLVTFAGVFGVLVFKNPWIAFAVFIPLPVYLLVVQHLTRRIYETEKIVNEQFEEATKEMYDVASNVLTVKKFSQEHIEVEKQIKLVGKARETQYEAEYLWEIIANTQTFISTVGRIAVILIAGFLVIRGASTIGDFVLYITLQNMAYGPIAQLSIIFPRLRRNIAKLERLFAIMDEPIHVTDKSGAPILQPLAKTVEFKKVTFHYTPGKYVLKDVQVAIAAHDTVALVGRSGSGKTTFINLLLRSFDPTRGGIYIDGIDIRDITQKSLRDQIAVVPQEVDLFSRSIAENIAYGRPDATRKEIEDAARIALAHDFIMRLPDGYDTLVGERGIRLSGGERQRVGIARAVLRDPKILILDEATSHLDTESEKLIQKATEAVMKNRTTIIIAHRLSTILKADKILVFNTGKLEAEGTHAALLKTSPTYQRLYSLQFAE